MRRFPRGGGKRDGGKHSSPNAGLGEAAFAGALGIQLGGLNYYAGEPEQSALLGEPLCRLDRRSILSANILAFVTTALFILASAAILGFAELAFYKILA